jgi:hypothetical protein
MKATGAAVEPYRCMCICASLAFLLLVTLGVKGVWALLVIEPGVAVETRLFFLGVEAACFLGVEVVLLVFFGLLRGLVGVFFKENSLPDGLISLEAVLGCSGICSSAASTTSSISSSAATLSSSLSAWKSVSLSSSSCARLETRTGEPSSMSLGASTVSGASWLVPSP